MSEDILKNIHIELVAIRELLAKAPAAAPAKTYSGASSDSGSSGPDLRNIPPVQPSKLIDDPDSVVIPWGKNNGRTLGSLSENSLRFYCEEPVPRLDSSGKPYPPRPADVELRNAARTLWHMRKGSLVQPNSGAFGAKQDRESVPDSGAADTGDVPFMRRDCDHG